MSDKAQNTMAEFIERYGKKPALFVQEVLGVEPLPYQAEFLDAIASGERKISIRSGHGTGKSTAASWAMLWFFMMHYPNKVVVTAPTSSQLFDALFAELKRWINELPEGLRQTFSVKSDRVEHTSAPSEMFISARTSRAETPEALAGVHSEHVMLVVVCVHTCTHLWFDLVRVHVDTCQYTHYVCTHMRTQTHTCCVVGVCTRMLHTYKPTTRSCV